MAALQEWKWPATFAGAFLLKDEPGADPSVVSGSESEKNISDVRGKELLNRLHKVGTLAQVSKSLHFFFPFCFCSFNRQEKKNLRQHHLEIYGTLLMVFSFDMVYQISSFREDEVILIGHGRLQITEMVS